ncbi:PAS domain-containing sensor histidine kinase [Methanospirillum lacunae]|uniref:Histidine kinase n=1 Tax=Methanospirillum lacunae TaxID=668570 RepID=A0A2V2N7Z1_9EURY|nr:PAS domain S-box protein [Methanospirillum lacunae]PWR72628.1 hypothetical protein DK846_06585 [Methanospirillum lacunae]
MTQFPNLIKRVSHFVTSPRFWIWAVILFTIFVCFSITWLHYHEQDEIKHITNDLDLLGTARIDLIKGFLHTTQGEETSSPYDKSQGYALLDQSIDSFEETINEIEKNHPQYKNDELTHTALFRDQVENFKNILNLMVRSSVHDDNLQIKLRVTLYNLEQQANLLDLALRESLQERTNTWNGIFILMLGFILFLLSGLCFAVLYSMNLTETAFSQLKDTEQKYRLLAENAGDVIWTMDLFTKRMNYVSPSVFSLLGYTPKETLVLAPEDLMTLDSFHSIDTHLSDRIKAMESGDPSSRVEIFTVDLKRKDRTIVPVEVVTTLIQNEDGAVSGMVGVVRDISERKITESALQESEERHRRVLDTMLEGFQILTPDFGYLYLNDEAVKQSGYSREELMNSTLLEKFPGIENTPLFAALKNSLENKIPQIIENEFKYPTGASSWFTLRIQPIKEGLAVLSVNITDQKKSEFELIKKNTELEAALEELCASEEEIKHNYEELLKSQEKLFKSEEKFRNLADYTYDWEYLINPDLEFEYITPSVHRISGYNPEDFYLKNITLEEIIHPDDRDMYNIHIQNFTNPEKVEIFFRIITKENEVKWISHHCYPVYDKDGIFLGRRAVNRDITDKKLIEDELIHSYEELENRVRERTHELTRKNEELDKIKTILEENQERLDRAQHVAHYGSWDIILNTNEFHCSPELLRIFGYDPDTTTPDYDRILTRVHPDDREKSLDMIRKTIHDKSSGSVTHRIILPNGETRTIFAQIEYFSDIVGDSSRIVGSSQDITDINQAMEERQRITREIHDLYNNAPCGYHSLDGTGLIIRMNDTELSWLMYTREEIINRMNIQQLLTPESFERFKISFPIFIKTGSLVDLELTFVRKDGTTFPVKVNASAIYDESGNYIMSRTIISDITEQKKYDETIFKSLREKEILLKEIHHRVKNNMQVISSLLFMQARNLKDPAVIELLNESQNRIRSLALIHEKLYQSDNLDHIDYGLYIKKIIDYLFQSYNVTKDDITVNLNISSIYLDIDKAVPCSLIINEMISNSLKHAFPKGKKGIITIDMSADEDSFHLEYVDNGIGLPDDQILEKSSSLGLQLIKGLSKQLGGELDIIREVGTCFILVFPK